MSAAAIAAGPVDRVTIQAKRSFQPRTARRDLEPSVVDPIPPDAPRPRSPAASERSERSVTAGVAREATNNTSSRTLRRAFVKVRTPERRKEVAAGEAPTKRDRGRSHLLALGAARRSGSKVSGE